MRWVVFVWGLLMGPAVAQDRLPYSSRDFDISELVQTLPDKTLKKLRDQPVRFIEAATELILGFGGQTALILLALKMRFWCSVPMFDPVNCAGCCWQI